MEPKNIRFGGGAADTLLHPAVAVWMIIAIILMLALPRKKAIAPFLLAVFTIPSGQVLLIGGAHFTVMRILILAGLFRAIRTKLTSPAPWFVTGFNPIDVVAVLWTVSAFVVINLQWMNSQMFVASLGDFLESLGGYLVIRFLIPDRDALRRTVEVFAVICVIHGVCMINEQITGVNLFSLLGDVGTPVEQTIRDGQLRSSGLLGPLGAGAFAGVLIPLFVWLRTERTSRFVAYAGLAGAGAMLVTTHASTPWLTFGAGLLGLSMWPLREHMQIFRWAVAVTLVSLHLVMKAPVWHLISRIDLTGSSSSWHRYTLVNQTIIHFTDWWLIGYRHYEQWDWDMWDTSNLFVAAALTGGLVTLVLVIMLFTRSFGAIGKARKAMNGNRTQEWFLWCLGSTFFACLVGSFGIAYLYQSHILLLTLPALISVAAFYAKQTSRRRLPTLQGGALEFPVDMPNGALVGDGRSAAIQLSEATSAGVAMSGDEFVNES